MQVYDDIRKQELFEQLLQHSDLAPRDVEVLTDAIDDFVYYRIKEFGDALAKQMETRSLFDVKRLR
jgi:hypothetical protein